MNFSEITGYKDTKEKLCKSVQNSHVAHALMFSSNEGGAGLQMALAYATYLNCENRQESDSCGDCPSCHKMKKLIHPDLSFFFPLTTTKKQQKPLGELFLNEWREFVLSQPFGTWVDWGKFIGAENKQLIISKEESKRILSVSSMKSFEGEYKINLIWLPEYLNVYSANALLKILEEPPAKTVFILITENPEKLLPTIVSRTQILRLPPYNVEELSDILQKHYGIEKEKAETVAQISQGNLNEAISLSGEVENTQHLLIREWLLDCYRNDALALVNKADEFQKWGREAQKAFLRLALSILRESIASVCGEDALLNIPENQKSFISKFSKTSGWEKIARISKELDKAYYHLERNLYPKIVFLDSSLIISAIFRT